MYGKVAKGTGLVFLRLIVKARRSGRTGRGSLGMATDAQEIHLVLHQHPRIRRAMRRMADHATFNLRFVLINEWSQLLAVALVADLVARRVRAQLFRAVRAVWTVAIVALQQTLWDSMMEGPRELRPNILMAAVAELRSLRLHQELRLFGVVGRMAVNASNPIGEVHRPVVVPMLFCVLVATETSRARLLRSGILEREDLRLVAPAVDMLFPRSVASLAPMPLHALVRVELRIHGGDKVRRLFETCVNLVVAGFAGVRPYV